MKAKSLDKKFDDGKDITKNLDISKAKRPSLKQKRVNVDFPALTTSNREFQPTAKSGG